MSAYRVFLSYTKDDIELITEWQEQFSEFFDVAETRPSVFYDRFLQYGFERRASLKRELLACHEQVVFLTGASYRRPWVCAEIGACMIRHDVIIPINFGVSETELMESGMLSLLGDRDIITSNELGRYFHELATRAANINP